MNSNQPITRGDRIHTRLTARLAQRPLHRCTPGCLSLTQNSCGSRRLRSHIKMGSQHDASKVLYCWLIKPLISVHHMLFVHYIAPHIYPKPLPLPP